MLPPRSELRDAISAAGGSLALFSQRLLLLAAALVGGLLLGALFRTIGLQSLNYGLMVLYVAMAAYVIASPVHLVLVVLAGGAAAVTGNAARILPAAIEYSRLIARALILFLVPLFMFARAPGDTSFAASMQTVFIAAFVLLAMFSMRRSFRRLQNLLFYSLPVGALALSLASMWVPQGILAAVGVPAWMRVDNPQADALAELENALQEQENEERARCLRAARRRIESGMSMSREHSACLRRSRSDRTSLVDRIGELISGWREDRQDRATRRREAARIARIEAMARARQAENAAIAEQARAEAALAARNRADLDLRLVRARTDQRAAREAPEKAGP